MSQKIALVTGSSRGIGRAIALKLATEGWDIVGHFARDFDAANALRSDLGSRCLGVIQADLGDPASTDQLWQLAVKMGSIDALVNNAGIYIPQSFDAEFVEWDRVRRETMRVNFEAPCELSRMAISYFLSQGHGKVLNVGSRVGFRGEPGAAFYAASKAALLNLTRSLAVEYASRGIQCFGIAPGWVETAMARDGMDHRLQEILSGIPVGRMAYPEDCAHAAAFLLSDESTYLTGEIIDINGASYFH